MKIWILNVNDDAGPTATPFLDRDSAEIEALNIVENWWRNWRDNDLEPAVPWREALAFLQGQTGFIDGLSLTEHDIDRAVTPANDPFEAAYLNAAKAARHRDGEIEIDNSAIVSRTDDGGAYVQAWVWVSDSDAGIHECEDCGEPFIEGDDSYCGLCPDCADKAEEEGDEGGDDE